MSSKKQKKQLERQLAAAAAMGPALLTHQDSDPPPEWLSEADALLKGMPATGGYTADDVEDAMKKLYADADADAAMADADAPAAAASAAKAKPPAPPTDADADGTKPDAPAAKAGSAKAPAAPPAADVETTGAAPPAPAATVVETTNVETTGASTADAATKILVLKDGSTLPAASANKSGKAPAAAEKKSDDDDDDDEEVAEDEGAEGGSSSGGKKKKPPNLTFQNSNSQQAALSDLESAEDSDAEDSEEDGSDVDFDIEKLRNYNKVQLEAKLERCAADESECEVAAKITGKSVLRNYNNVAKEIGDADAKATEQAKIVTVLGTFNKYKEMAAAIGDKTVFLLLSEVFQAEYNSQVAIPKELETIRDEEYKIRRVLNEKKEEEVREYNSKLDSKKERKKEAVSASAEKRSRAERDLVGESSQLAIWQQSSFKPRKQGTKKAKK